MQYELLFENIAQHIEISEEEKSFIISLLHYKKIRKRQFFLQEGEVQKHVVFVTGGCLRSYSIDKNGFEHILQFAPEGWWIGDLHSFNTQQPATLNIDAVGDSEVVLLSKPDLEKIYSTIPRMERFFRILAENALATYQQRLIDNLSLPAIDRYSNFCKRYPSLIDYLPQKQVAAYIGVTPEFLSKMLSQANPQK